ncbi:hypothetical protein JYT74_00325 [Crocinitomix catalasitica]|nr:hypothetical protein [Crocinitomix catalasitica]
MKTRLSILLILFMIAPCLGYSQEKKTDVRQETYKDIRIGDAQIDTEIYQAEFSGQKRLRMVDRENNELAGFVFMSGELKIEGTDQIGRILKGGLLSEEAIKLLENSEGKIIKMFVKYCGPDGKVVERNSRFEVKSDSEK